MPRRRRQRTAGRRTGQWRDIRRRFVRNKLALIGLVMVLIVMFVAMFAPLIAPYGPKAQDLFNTESRRAASLVRHRRGRPRPVHPGALRRSDRAAGRALVDSCFTRIGVFLGSIAGYFGRFWDSLIMRICDIFFAFPLLVGAIVVITVVGQGVLR